MVADMSDHGWADETVRHSVVAAGALYEWMRGAASDISAAGRCAADFHPRRL